MRQLSLAALAAASLLTLPRPSAAAEPEPAAPAADPAPAPQPKPPKWKGFKVTSDDGKSSLRIGTLMQVDGYGFPGDEAKSVVDEVRLRRFRLGLRATFLEHYDVRWVIELADSRLNVLDAVIELTHLDALRLRVGKDKAPHSYDVLHASSATTFLELGPTALLGGNRDLGVQLVGVVGEGLLDYQIGLFDGVADGASVDADNDDRFELAGRLTFKPFKHAGSAALADLALGVAGGWGEALGTRIDAANVPTYRTNGRATWFRYAAGADLATTVVADGARARVAGHLDWRAGPFGLFGEAILSTQDLRLGDVTATVSNVAWQAYASIVLTGERSSRSGVEPAAPFDPATGGAGAFELAVRYGELAIDAAAFDEGLADPTRSAEELSTLTIGFNWYLNAAVKLQLDYERSAFTGGAASGDRATENLIGGRIQVNY